MAGLSELGQLSDEETADLTARVERFVAAWKPDGSAALEPFLPPPGARHRPLALVRIVTADMERRAAAKLPFRCERYVNDFPDELSTNSMPVALLAAEYRLRHQYTDKPALSEYERWFPSQFGALKQLIEPGGPAALTKIGEQTPVTPVNPLDLPRASTLIDGRKATPSQPRPGLKIDPNKSAMPSDVLPHDAQYQLVKRLGNGAFGEVFEALAPGGVRVAIKRILRTVDHPASQSELEALEAIKQLAHPFLLKTNAYWVFDDKLVIVMDLADCSLADRIDHHNKQGATGVPPEELIPLFEQAGDALDYLHSQNVSHRDVKPENILMLRGYAKVGDFGLARLHEHTMTAVGNTVGTPAYMAPEMWKQKVSLQSDQYSLAATYIRARLGRHLFSTNVLVDMANSHIHDTPNLDPLPKPEQEVLLKALAKNPDARYPSCAEFAKALRVAVFPPPPTPPSVILMEPPKLAPPSKTGALLRIVAFLIVIAASVVTLWSQLHKEPPKVEEKEKEKPPTVIVEKPVPVPQEKPFAEYPKGWSGDPKSEIKELGGKRYHARLTRDVGGEVVVALFVPKGSAGDPEHFYILEHKLTNKAFATTWEQIKNRSNLAVYRSKGLLPEKWRRDLKGNELDVLGVDADLPVLGVTFPEAFVVAEELGGSLLSFSQWFKAAGLREPDVTNGPAGPPLTEEEKALGPEEKQKLFAKRQLALGYSERPLAVRSELAKGDVSRPWGVRQLVTNGKEWLGEDKNRTAISLDSPLEGRIDVRVVGYNFDDPFVYEKPSLGSGLVEQFLWTTVRDTPKELGERGTFGFRIVLKPQ